MNLSPKQKAEELIEKFSKHSRQDTSGFLVSNEDPFIKNAKACALIAVNEIINSGPNDVEMPSHDGYGEIYSGRTYWEKVKTELEKL